MAKTEDGRKKRPRVMTWRAMVSLPEELGAKVDRMAADRLMEPAIVLRQLVKERLDQMDREEERREREEQR